MYKLRLLTSHLQAVYKLRRRIKRYNFLMHDLMMVCWKPKHVHATEFVLFKYKLILTDVIVADIVLLTKQCDNLP
jgi:hypothetical protein